MNNNDCESANIFIENGEAVIQEGPIMGPPPNPFLNEINNQNQEENRIEDLKYAIYDEWASNPPAGVSTIHFDVYGTSYEDLAWPVDEMYDHLSYSLYDEEAEEFEEYYNSFEPTKEGILNYSWDNGGLGCGCGLLAEGKEITEKAAEFYKDVLEDWLDFDDAENIDLDENQKLIEAAVKNPEDYDSVIKMLDMISMCIEHKNYRMLS